MLTPARRSAAAAARSDRLLWRMKDSVARVNRRVADGGVALTCDDGPQPGTTDRILDVLAELDIRPRSSASARTPAGILRRAVVEALGADTRLFRPPHGRLGPARSVLVPAWQ